MDKLGIVSVGRSDFSILKPLIADIEKNYKNYQIFASTAHFSKTFGYTASEIYESFPKKSISIVDTKIIVKSPLLLSKSISMHVQEFAKHFSKNKIKKIILLGDRYETLAAAIAATSLSITINHLHGGVITLGSMDNAFRNAISEMSHYHFVDNKNAKKRLLSKGFDIKKVFFAGSLAVENIHRIKNINTANFFKKVFNSDKPRSFAIATYHPSTTGKKDDLKVIKNIIKSVTESKIFLIFTFPNADLNNQHIINLLQREAKNNSLLIVRKNLGASLYFQALTRSNFMIGNSSSGIIESGACKIPAINIGNRQEGRDCNPNVVHCNGTQKDIKKSLREIKKPSFIKRAFQDDIYFRENTSKYILEQMRILP